MVRPDLMDLMVHEELDALLLHMVQPGHTVRLDHLVQQSHTVRLDLTLQVADPPVVEHYAVQRVAHMDRSVPTDLPGFMAQLDLTGLTHQLGPACGSLCRCVRSDRTLLKLDFRKRHVVTSNSG